jgi:hypothetical protein
VTKCPNLPRASELGRDPRPEGAKQRVVPDSEAGQFKMELSCLLTTNYIVKTQLRPSWVCAMEIIENKPVSPEFRQICVNPYIFNFGIRDNSELAPGA